MKQITIREAFEIAIAAENSAAALYRGLESKFADHDDLVAVWQRFARDEDDHAEWLGEMRARLAAEHLARQVDVETVALLQAVQKISIKKALESIQDLDDACRVVDEIENGETNAVFQFLLNNFEMDLQLRGFLRKQLDQHVAMLEVELPAPYRDRFARKEIQALP